MLVSQADTQLWQFWLGKATPFQNMIRQESFNRLLFRRFSVAAQLLHHGAVPGERFKGL
jgi:hypothetical protein